MCEKKGFVAGVVYVLLLLGLAPGASAQTGMPESVMGGGGGVVTGSGYRLNATIGQASVGSASGPYHSIHSGYWGSTGAALPSGTETPPVVAEFSLEQNYPNPFNPNTTIRYSVPAGPAVQVSLEIYDVRGGRVRTLVDGARAPGIHDIVWDGANDRGQRVASGIYFYRLSAPGFVRTRKMVVLK